MKVTRAMNTHERSALQAIRAWQAEPPGPATRWFAKAAGPASQAVQNALPPGMLRTALTAAQRAARAADGDAALVKRAGVVDIDGIRALPLHECDALAEYVQRRAWMLAGAGGALFGVAGRAGLVMDVPSLLVLALRTIQRVGLCYGESCLQDDGDRLPIAIFAAASANTLEEKQQAVAGLHGMAAEDFDEAAWRDGVERAAERELAKEAAAYSVNNLARSLSVRLGMRKATLTAPLVGAVIGGGVNSWYLWDVGRVAQRCFQERWLYARYPKLAREQRVVPLQQAH